MTTTESTGIARDRKRGVNVLYTRQPARDRRGTVRLEQTGGKPKKLTARDFERAYEIVAEECDCE